jgi:hypothetical protein
VPLAPELPELAAAPPLPAPPPVCAIAKEVMPATRAIESSVVLIFIMYLIDVVCRSNDARVASFRFFSIIGMEVCLSCFYPRNPL